MRPTRDNLSPSNLLYRGIPREFHNATIDQYPIETDKRKIIERYVNNLDQMLSDCVNLTLYGKNGAGKTYLSSLIILEAYRQRYSSMRITLQKYIDMKFRSKEEDIAQMLKDIRESEFLVIDEVGKETFDKSSFNIASCEDLMRERDTLGLPTIICTNLPLEENGGIYEQYGKSIRSLIEGKSVKMEFLGDDFRHGVASKKKGIQILMGDDNE